MAFGQWGPLNARAGFVVAGANELPEDIRDYVERLVAPYFAAVAEWYATLRIGVTGGVLQAVIDRHLSDKFFGMFLNPGHQIHLDEWVNSPVYEGSEVVLRSGMALPGRLDSGDRQAKQLFGRQRVRRRFGSWREGE